MSNTDSFIEEVTEEVRRDRLFGMLRRYAWVGILAVLLIVGGATYNEWRKAQERTRAQTLGDGMLAALDVEAPDARAEALAQISAQGTGQEAILSFARAGELAAAGDTAAAAELLDQLATNGEIPQIYRQIAGFRALTLQPDLAADQRRLQFEAFTDQGGILRLLAEEQIALIDLETGDRDAALATAQAILQDAEATSGLRRRATQLILALGGELPSDLAGAADAPVQE
ncbi:hypothetical protein M8756_00760 [Lutimaribacter sp. EGI FJ00015]|uniref:Uncharacterized protein n=1 Tax=Lutimaribacter degradans TaxID=2945989 RepID=A0ACC5ZSC0_9RHOB|nr:hypothetical protein [Lutimaribacter sp. EGI FJ00013]MCO0611822.1 hypothetical protein [Lutimaribacter sp. EGI FJ00015]MCO0635057.1 hypothetical protein [Lutimaribacter sp. EGI FJ00014]